MPPDSAPAPGFTEVIHGSSLYGRTVALREALLRRPLGMAFDAEELAAEVGSHHLAALHGDEVLACLVLLPRAGASVQMRQVAVTAARQRQGLGAALVAFAERFAAARGYDEMLVHARESVAPFYDRLGYERAGPGFIEVTLPHLPLRKRLGTAAR